MPRTAASLTQADVARVIRAAKQEGAAEVEVHSKDGGKIVVRLSPSTAPEIAVEPKREVVL